MVKARKPYQASPDFFVLTKHVAQTLGTIPTKILKQAISLREDTSSFALSLNVHTLRYERQA